MAFDVHTEDVIVVEDQPQEGTCRFRGSVLFSEGYHKLFESKFHQDRSSLHIIAAILEKYPQGAHFQQRVVFNDVRILVFEKAKKVYLMLESEYQGT